MKVTVRRKWMGQSSLVKLKVYADGNLCGEVKNGGTLEFDAPNGTRQIKVEGNRIGGPAYCTLPENTTRAMLDCGYFGVEPYINLYTSTQLAQSPAPRADSATAEDGNTQENPDARCSASAAEAGAPPVDSEDVQNLSEATLQAEASGEASKTEEKIFTDTTGRSPGKKRFGWVLILIAAVVMFSIFYQSPKEKRREAVENYIEYNAGSSNILRDFKFSNYREEYYPLPDMKTWIAYIDVRATNLQGNYIYSDDFALSVVEYNGVYVALGAKELGDLLP